MNRTIKSVIFLILISSAVFASDHNWAVRIADSFIKLHPDTIAYPSEAKSYRWNYEQGLMEEAFYQLWQTTGDDKYYDYLKKNIDYYINENGSIKTYRMDDFNIDNVSPGRILLYLYEITREEKYKKAADTLRRQLELHPRTASGGFWHKKVYPDQMWLDGLFMGEPFYTKYSVMFNDAEAFDDIAKQFILIEEHLKDANTGLYYHGWDESKKEKWSDPLTGRSPNFWGRSIGWFMMALVDVLDNFPQQHPGRIRLIKILQDLSASVLHFRDPETKLWFQVVDKGDKEGNYIEASASSMFTYAFAKGANKGYLENRYFEEAKTSFDGIINNLVKIKDNNIYLENVVSVSGLGGNPYRDGSFEYYISEPKRTNDFKGYGPFLLAAIELENGSNGSKKVGLDYYFNREFKNGEQYHYTWEDTSFSGFSDLGNIIKKLNAEILSVKKAPAKDILDNLDIYIIVDPDTKAETASPNYIDSDSRNAIIEWVRAGGVLVILANDSANCEFDSLNLLSGSFGIYFRVDSKNRVTGNKYEMGRINNFLPHPVFKDVNSIYLKEVSTLTLKQPAVPVLKHEGNILAASAAVGSGFVFAVGDPWFYNEYIDSRKLPASMQFENFKAAENLFAWLLSMSRDN